MSLKSYVKNEAGYETIELMEDSLLYCLKRSDLYRLFEEAIDIANWGRKLAELEFLRAEEKLIPLLFTFHLFELSFAQLFEIAIFTMRFNSGL